MSKSPTLLEGLCGHALALGADSIDVEYQDRHEWVYELKGGVGISIANYKSSSADARELRENLYAAAKRPSAPSLVDGFRFSRSTSATASAKMRFKSP